MGKTLSKDVPVHHNVDGQETRSDLRDYLETLTEIANTGQASVAINSLGIKTSQSTCSSDDTYPISPDNAHAQSAITIPQIRVLSMKSQTNSSSSLPETSADPDLSIQDPDCEPSTSFSRDSEVKSLSTRRKLFKKSSSAEERNLQRKTVKKRHLFKHSVDSEMQSSQEWDNMQDWMTWCLHHHLSQDDGEDDVSTAPYTPQRQCDLVSKQSTPSDNRRKLLRQMSFDKSPSNKLHLKSHSQGTSSFESTSDCRTISSQNSFDSAQSVSDKKYFLNL